MKRAVAIALLVLVAAAGCGDDDSAEPESAPLGLGTVALPGSGPDIAAAFQRMPDEVGGFPAGAGTDFELIRRYGDLSTIVAFPFEEGAEALAADLSRFQFEEGATVESSQLDPDRGTLWVMGTFSDQGGAGLVHLLVWADPDAGWVFNVSTQTAEMREGIVRAFVESVAGG
jgi:hypothetical protein